MLYFSERNKTNFWKKRTLLQKAIKAKRYDNKCKKIGHI